MTGSGRDEGVDVARGLAVVTMISTHAYDGWVLDEARASAGYQLTRLLGVLPLPTFLGLAGLGLALRRAGRHAADPDHTLREGLRAGLRVLLAGYAVSAALALLDGGVDLRTVLRSDVLHAIGLSTMGLALLLRALHHVRAPAVVGLSLAGLVLATTPAATRFGRSLEGVPAALASPFVEVPGLTKMPVWPLCAFVLLGAFAWPPLVRASDRTRRRVLACATLAAVGLASMTAAWVASVSGPFDRTHPAIVGNGLDLAARATATLACALVCTPHLPATVRAELARLGRHSLLAYAVHLPFAYGRIVRPLRHALSMGEATAAFVLLLVGVSVVVRVRERLARR